ncbi:PAS domain-containing protein [Massilia sp. DWR3-1-1]|uniref:PAS domain-containing protein n=1 Tax=Massilia sp. DWR3-1-1 TaxID=2804559 RepID=UPI003CEDF4A6
MRQPPHSEDEPGLFLEDEDVASAAVAPHGEGESEVLAPWRILIVDDDVDVHVVTKFALSSASFQGRRLSFVHAYSAVEALAKLRDTPDIALVLLDVMMETADAGLQLALQVREQLHNDLVRIVLRTGQPGQAIEHSIIVDYDINDFWSKTDLTTRKLFTTVIAALRAYATLDQAAKGRNRALARQAQLEKQLAAARAAAAMVAIDGSGIVVDANDAAAALAGVDLPALLGRAAAGIAPAPLEPGVLADIGHALAGAGAWSGIIDVHLPAGTRRLRCALCTDGAGGVIGYASPTA